jgi:hypothetical protein
MSLQLQTVYDAYARAKQDISDVSDDIFTDWCKYLQNFVYRYISGIEPERFISTQSYTITGNPSTQALPVSFRDMSKFGTGLYMVSNGVTTNITLP